MENREVEYAGFWTRTGAALIDSVLTLLVTFPLMIALYGWSYFDPEQSALTGGTADFLISWVFPAIAVLTFWIMKQATPGKMAFSARIVDAASGEPASIGQLVGRYFAYIVSTIPLCLGFLWVAFDRKKQGWHDKLAGTVVVRQQVPGKRSRRGMVWIVAVVMAYLAIGWIGGFAGKNATPERAVKTTELTQPPAKESGARQHRGPVEPAVAPELSVSVPVSEQPSAAAETATPSLVPVAVATSTEAKLAAIAAVEKTALVPAPRKAYATGDLRHCLDHQTNERIVRCVER